MNDLRYLFMRHLRKSLREPVWIFVNLFEPVLYLTLFMPLLRGLGNAPGLPAGEIERTFVPGLLVMVTIFGVGFVGFGAVDDKRIGFVERIMVTPARRTAILLSMIGRDLVMLLAQVVIVICLAIPLGFSISLIGLLPATLLLLAVGVVMASFSYALAFTVRDEGGLASTTNLVYLPILLLSGIMLPLDLAPHWLKILSEFNPFSYVVNAERLMFAGTILHPEVGEAYFFTLALAVGTVGWSVKMLKKMSA